MTNRASPQSPLQLRQRESRAPPCGRLPADCIPRHAAFWGRQIHLICDDYGTHRHLAVKQWLSAHPRLHPHFAPSVACRQLELECLGRFAGPNPPPLSNAAPPTRYLFTIRDTSFFRNSVLAPCKMVKSHPPFLRRTSTPLLWYSARARYGYAGPFVNR